MSTLKIDGLYNKQEVYDINWNRFIRLLRLLPDTNGTMKLTTEEAPTTIALEVYGNSRLWWIILAYNNLSPTATLKPSTELKLFALKDLNNLWKSILADSKTLEITRSL